MIVPRFRRLILASVFTFSIAFSVAVAQEPNPEDLPEEDEALSKPEYAFNPLQARKELRVGNFYFKKGSWKAAANRFREATRWNPKFAEAYFRLGEAHEKLNDPKAAREAFSKYLELDPDGKYADEAKKRLKKLASACCGRSYARRQPSRGTGPPIGIPG
jgi:outer membrane protein assembly factor BamD (BamD/ComL family)